MTAQTKGVDVLAVMDEAAGKLVRSPNPAIAAHSTAVGEARAAIAKLIEASRRTIRAFEALGTSSWGSEYASRVRDCEAAMVAQKEVLDRVGGAQ